MTTRNILFTFQSCADLNAIWEAIAMPRDQWGVSDAAQLAAAEAFADKFEKVCELLPRHPEVGTRRDELIAGICSVPVGRHAVFYRTRGENVEVLRVLRAGSDAGPGPTG